MYRGPEPEEDGAEEPKETPPPPPAQNTAHLWEHIPLGRAWVACQLVQENGEFDDDVPCESNR